MVTTCKTTIDTVDHSDCDIVCEFGALVELLMMCSNACNCQCKNLGAGLPHTKRKHTKNPHFFNFELYIMSINF